MLCFFGLGNPGFVESGVLTILSVTTMSKRTPVLSVASVPGGNSVFHRTVCHNTVLTIVTWLILPVVICLSQRLSHACLSISTCTVKLRMAH